MNTVEWTSGERARAGRLPTAADHVGVCRATAQCPLNRGSPQTAFRVVSGPQRNCGPPRSLLRPGFAQNICFALVALWSGRRPWAILDEQKGDEAVSKVLEVDSVASNRVVVLQRFYNTALFSLVVLDNRLWAAHMVLVSIGPAVDLRRNLAGLARP